MRYSVFALLGIGLIAALFFFQDLLAENEVLVQRRQRLQQMSDAEKTRLLEKKDRFEELRDARQQQYRALHQKLVNHPKYEELRATLERYSDWIKTITPTQRAELAKLSPEDRLGRVRELMDEQATERFRLMVNQVFKSKNLLNREDLSVICEWTDAFLHTHADEILATMPAGERFEKMKARFGHDQHIRLLRWLYFRPGPMRFRGPPPSDGPPGFSPPSGRTREEDEPTRKVEPASSEDAENSVEHLPTPSPRTWRN